MTTQKNCPAGGGTPEGRTSKKNHRGNLTISDVHLKEFLVERGSSGISPVGVADMAIRLFKLETV